MSLAAMKHPQPTRRRNASTGSRATAQKWTPTASDLDKLTDHATDNYERRRKTGGLGSWSQDV
ncbi:hypothetical protein [Dasania marina]|uniref:hypothetical protein n=1 Tax=Dasania marina TaxID=471499 RepID=UPI0030DD3E83|tara:strand:- start:12054 stop:12242 length:189 start_codon:yes stop_codon:yes gene_type:complete